VNEAPTPGTTPEPSAAVTWVAAAVVVGGMIAGAVLVERALSRTWARMREDIHPFAPAAASLQRTRATYRRRFDHASDVADVAAELIRLAPRSR
jgi:hypothetical protein